MWHGVRIVITHQSTRGRRVSNHGAAGIVRKNNGSALLVELDDGRTIWTRARYVTAQNGRLQALIPAGHLAGLV